MSYRCCHCTTPEPKPFAWEIIVGGPCNGLRTCPACRDRIKRALRDALESCREALQELAQHPAFEDDAPEFNMGGIGYEAYRAAKVALAEEDGGAS